jgi:hypothetical protein
MTILELMTQNGKSTVPKPMLSESVAICPVQPLIMEASPCKMCREGETRFPRPYREQKNVNNLNHSYYTLILCPSNILVISH